MIKATTKVGATTITVEAEEPKELFQQIGFFSEMPQKCGHCGSEHINPTHRKVKGYDFYSIKCGECRYEFRFGQTKEDGSLFPKNGEGWVAPYSGGGGNEFEEESPRTAHRPASRPAPRPVARPAVEDDDEIPF